MKTIKSLFLAVASLLFYGITSGQSINQREVIFKSKADSITIGATISSPIKAGKYPAVIIVSGTGPQDRDGTMAGTKMFARIANFLTPKRYVSKRTYILFPYSSSASTAKKENSDRKNTQK